MSAYMTLARMAASNTSKFSLLTSREIQAAGIGQRQLAELIHQGLLHRVRRGFYSLDPPCWRVDLAAALERVGPNAVVSHRSAARLRGLTSWDDLDLTIRYPADARATGVEIHRSRDLVADDVETVDGFPTTSIVRTLVDLGLVLPPSEVERLVDHAVATNLITPSELRDLRQRVGEHGRTGVGMIDAALDGMPELAGDTESGPELRLLKLLERSALPDPIPQVWVVARGRRYRLDFAYPALFIALEYDGAEWHSTPAQLAYDARRQADLESIGWTVFRYGWNDLHGDGRVAAIARLAEMVRRRTKES